MLIEFSVKNFRSIKEEQTLSLVKSKSKELEATNSFKPDVPNSVPLLRSAVIYGANAAGKSNVILAMLEMETIVRESASSGQEGDELSIEPFLFDEKSASEPSEFEIVFIAEGVRYQYGFTATKHQILEEWLIAYPKGRSQHWFSRDYDTDKNESIYKFGDLLTGKKSVWQSATRENALFLSTAVQLNSSKLKPVFNWFKENLRLSAHPGSWGAGYSASLCDKESTREKVVAFLKAADFDIEDIKIDKKKFDFDTLPKDMPDSMKERLIKDFKDRELVDIKTIHKTTSDNLVLMDLDEESDGTQQVFSLAGPWLDVLENGYTLVIDELHNNLHPKIVKYLVNLFHDEKTNPNNAQLIFTTHETSILNQDVFRRDQIWFCEKDDTQATTLYPLTDFSPRKNRENIELGYLSGRYGALPYVKDLKLERAQ